MKKLYTLLLFVVFSQITYAQVGIGNTNPKAQLDITSSNQATPSNTDGILIPKVDVFPATNPTVAQQGMLVYLTTTTTFLATSRNPGFYYWDNTTSDWIGISSSSGGDQDWYEVGTTTPPDDINDDMFHMGNAAIGKNTISNARLDVATTASDSSIKNTLTNNTNNTIYGINNSVSGGGTGIHYGSFTSLTGTGTGIQYGNYNEILNSSATAQNTGTYNLLNNSSIGLKIGVQNEITGTNNSNQSGVFNLMTTNGNGFHIGTYNQLNSTGTGARTGTANTMTGSSSGIVYGTTNDVSNSGGGVQYGSFNAMSSGGAGDHYGVYSSLSGAGLGNQYGNYTSITNSGANTQYGSYTTISGNGLGGHTGNYNLLSGSSAGVQTGTYNEITNTAGSSHYGAVSNLSGSGAATKYGFSSIINSAAGGTHYGVYSTVLKPGATNFAGYFLGNVGIGTTTINTYTLPASRGTLGQTMRTDGLGNVTWANNSDFAWSTTGNAGLNGGTTLAAGTNFIGTTDAQNIDFRTNNTFRGRFSSLGEFFVGTLNTVLTGDLCNAVGNATFPWAMNGYTDFNGAGSYGQVTSGTTLYAGVQGEYNGTNAQGAGVRGISLTATAGTSFTAPHTGVSGNATTGGTYKFGVYGSGGTTGRSGGVMGNDYGIANGALGYYSFAGLDYAVYGFGQAHTTGGATGRMANPSLQKNTTIGLGIYGGVMGGWVRGMKYGFHTKGETYSLYVDGNGYTNKPLAYLINIEGRDKVASYMTTSMSPEVTVNGKSSLVNGQVFIAFDAAFKQIIANIDDVIITASPQGKSNGIYIDNITKEGFWVYENNEGTSNVKISWIAISKIKGEETPKVPEDLLAKDFDNKMDHVMFNENNTQDTPQSLWWDGSKIRWDRPTNDKRDTQTEMLARPK